MSDARWLDVDVDIATAVRHFENAIALSGTGGFDGVGLDRYRAEMALMHAMQSAHTATEAGLLRILRIFDEERPTGDDWHARLIDRLARVVEGQHARPALLTPAAAADLHETRSFRHRVMHSYGQFNLQRSAPALAAADRLASALPGLVATFKQATDPAH
ncbi:hypothetical protein [uncultured Devosia sp.]|uniref:ribonuclease toxin HepT-like protein n=1 Tax=uncultured Devosia sp. TaxID=211434 RepID=UPI0035CAD4DD